MASIETRNFSEDPRISAMLGSAGITALDMELFHSLRERDFSVFLHGSLVQKEGVVGATSDVDFSLVGEYASLPKDLIDTIAPRFSEINQIYPVDYMSSSFFSRGGRKMSLHFNSPDFRRCYASGETGTQVAREYRPARHAKKDPRDYLLPGIDQSGNVRLLNFRCTSRMAEIALGRTTTIPQTGEFMIDGADVYLPDGQKVDMEVVGAVKISPNGTAEHGIGEEFRTMVLGLEFDKMHSDTPVFRDNEGYEEYVLEPIDRSKQLIGEYVGRDGGVVVRTLFEELSRFWKDFKPNKQRGQ